MEQTAHEFFHDFRQELLAGAEANGDFQLSAFIEAVANELVETGFVEGFELCHFRAARGMRVDGYWFDDEGGLTLFVADFDCRSELESLTRTEVDAAFKRVVNFFEGCLAKNLYHDLEITSSEYGLARQIADRKGTVRQVRFILLSERTLSDRIQTLEDNKVEGVPASYSIWDVSRLQRQRSSRGHKEPLDIDFAQMFGKGIPCLSAHLGSQTYRSYLVVMPGEVLAALYDKFGARLLEQNVRCFLQARGNVNKGIRATILKEPQMFFAYNNGITATAQEVEIETGKDGQQIAKIRDLQIVNGGQTTASLFHTKRRDKVPLSQIFVQMKLSVITGDDSEIVVPRISEYANTQNRVNAADFFANHPFHIRIQDFSRRLWAPAAQGAQRETRWFYERARGQYGDAQAKLTPAGQKRFVAEHPKPQMFTKTDLAKFENSWDEHPKWVNRGSQKNFAQYAGRIGKEWEQSPDDVNEFYFRRAIARGIIFRATEKVVSKQPWYSGDFRANIVVYAIAALNEISSGLKRSVDFSKVWTLQGVPAGLHAALSIATAFINEDITHPPDGVTNIGEWCKRDQCWTRLQANLPKLQKLLPPEFFAELIPLEELGAERKDARKTQKVDDGIGAQRRVVEISASLWSSMLEVLSQRRLLSPKEIGILKLAAQLPQKIPTEKQCLILLEVLKKAVLEGMEIESPGTPDSHGDEPRET